jgi:hypothetical protein
MRGDHRFDVVPVVGSVRGRLEEPDEVLDRRVKASAPSATTVFARG